MILDPTAKMIVGLIALALIAIYMTSCSSGDHWDDDHIIFRYHEKQKTVMAARDNCRDNILKLWGEFVGRRISKEKLEQIEKICVEQNPMPKLPEECLP